MKYCLLLGFVLLSGCASDPPIQPPVAKHAVPTDESRKMPIENRLSTTIVGDHILGRSWLPGGTSGHYRKGAKEWDLILVKADSPATAAIWLVDYKKELQPIVEVTGQDQFSPRVNLSASGNTTICRSGDKLLRAWIPTLHGQSRRFLSFSRSGSNSNK